MPYSRYMQTFTQKYPSAYYAAGPLGEHYVMYNKIRTRYGSQDEALKVCEDTNEKYGLPNINVYRSSYFNRKDSHVS